MLVKEVPAITITYLDIHKAVLHVSQPLVERIPSGLFGNATESVAVRLKGIRMHKELAIKDIEYMGLVEALAVPINRSTDTDPEAPAPLAYAYSTAEVLCELDGEMSDKQWLALGEDLIARERPHVYAYVICKHSGFARSDVAEEIFLAITKLLVQRKTAIISDMLSFAG